MKHAFAGGGGDASGARRLADSKQPSSASIKNTLTAAVLRVAAHCARATSGEPATGLGYAQSAESAVTRVAIDTSFLKLNTILVVGDVWKTAVFLGVYGSQWI